MNKYGKVKVHGIRLLWLLSISLLGGCAGIRAKDYMGHRSNTESVYQDTSGQGGFPITVWRTFKDNFLNCPNFFSYTSSLVAPYIWEGIGSWAPCCVGWSVGKCFEVLLDMHNASCEKEGSNAGNQAASQCVASSSYLAVVKGLVSNCLTCTACCRFLGSYIGGIYGDVAGACIGSVVDAWCVGPLDDQQKALASKSKQE